MFSYPFICLNVEVRSHRIAVWELVALRAVEDLLAQILYLAVLVHVSADLEAVPLPPGHDAPVLVPDDLEHLVGLLAHGDAQVALGAPEGRVAADPPRPGGGERRVGGPAGARAGAADLQPRLPGDAGVAGRAPRAGGRRRVLFMGMLRSSREEARKYNGVVFFFPCRMCKRSARGSTTKHLG